MDWQEKFAAEFTEAFGDQPFLPKGYATAHMSLDGKTVWIQIGTGRRVRCGWYTHRLRQVSRPRAPVV